jgi:hypothetical protein
LRHDQIELRANFSAASGLRPGQNLPDIGGTAGNPALTKRQAAIIGGACLASSRSTRRFQMPAQGRHQYGIHRTATADGDFCPFFPVDRKHLSIRQAGGDRGMEQRRTVGRVVKSSRTGTRGERSSTPSRIT